MVFMIINAIKINSLFLEENARYLRDVFFAVKDSKQKLIML